jgi:hypothetical protein
MAEHETGELSGRLEPLLKEYDLPTVLMVLSGHLMSAVNVAKEAPTLNNDLRAALEYAEQKTFWTNDAIKNILAIKT